MNVDTRVEQEKDTKKVHDCIRDRWCGELRNHNDTITLLGLAW